MTSKDQKKNLVDATSLVTKYEVLLLEQGENGLTQDRIVLIFQVWDEIIPHLGIFSKLMKLIRDEVYDAVFSYEHTATPRGGLTAGAKKAFIQRVPFFQLVKTVYAERHEEADKLNEQLETVKTKLFNKHKDLEDAQQTIADLNNKIDSLNDDIDDLNSTIKENNSEIDRLEQTLAEDREHASNVQHQLNCDIDELNDGLCEAKEEIKELSKYKKGYDDMYYAFLEDAANIGRRNMSVTSSATRQKPVIATKRANFISNIDSARKLEQQILNVLNTTIEEFDKAMEDHKKELEEKQSENVDDFTYQIQQQHIEQAAQELWQVQDRFKRTIDNINEELGLIRQHTLMMEEQLQILEDNKPTTAEKALRREAKKVKSLGEASNRATQKDFDDMKQSVISGRPHSSGKDSILSAGLEDDDEEATKEDPFIPHERIFSKYSAMMFTSSNGGQTWHGFKDGQFCESCGEKTVLCPHRSVLEEKIFIMPHNVTHIKVTRPKVRINREVIDQLVKPYTADTDIHFMRSDSDVRKISTADSLTAHRTTGQSPAGATPVTGGSATADAHMKHSYGRLWDDYKTRTMLQRTIPRPIAMDRVLSMIEQFYAKMIWQDDYGPESDGFCSITDNLYKFMSERYLKPDVTYLATHDLLSAVIESSSINRVKVAKSVSVFGHMLIGNLDSVCFRYILLMADFIDRVEWKEVEDFRTFASVVYPFLGDDDLESVQMGYTSFSEHKVSKQLVYQYLLYMTLKYREPRFLESEAKLILHPGLEAGVFNEQEFYEAVDHVIPLSNEKLRKRLFWETEASMKSEGIQQGTVTVMRLSQITGYLGLLQITKLVKETIMTTVNNARELRAPSAKSSTKQDPGQSVTHDNLLTLTKVKNLAANVAKRENSRRKREDSEDDFYSN